MTLRGLPAARAERPDLSGMGKGPARSGRAPLGVFADQCEGLGKIRVGHAGHGDEEMVGKIDAVH